jgi:hypothetical protein
MCMTHLMNCDSLVRAGQIQFILKSVFCGRDSADSLMVVYAYYEEPNTVPLCTNVGPFLGEFPLEW